MTSYKKYINYRTKATQSQSGQQKMNLFFNNVKLKYKTSPSNRKVNDKSYLIRSDRNSLAEETTLKLLGVTFDQNLTCSSHVSSIAKASDGILRTLKTFKRFPPFKVRKSLAESLVQSRLNYSDYSFWPITKVPSKPTTTCTKEYRQGYAIDRYDKRSNVINLNWLPIHESIKCTSPWGGGR